MLSSLLYNPTEDFVKWLIRQAELVDGNITPKVIGQFIPIVKKAIENTVLEVATRSIKQRPDETPAVPPVKPPAVVATGAAGAAKEQAAAGGDVTKIVTTPEELEVYETVKKICSDSSFASKHPIQYKDAVNYFGINLGSSRKWFIRAFCDAKRKSIATRLPVDKATLLAQGFEVEAAPDLFGKSRIYFNSVRDLEKLRALIHFAFEEECRRLEAGGCYRAT